MANENMKNIADSLPMKPGCYIFKDEDGQVLYVGKSKSLKKRVASYFKKQKDERIAQMMHFATDLSYKCVDTDIEALLLEYSLIKQHRPPYNVKMQKDRQYWYINVEGTLLLISQDKSEKFAGPFYRKEHAEDALIILGDYWPISVCQARQKGPCLRFHIKQCLAPCSEGFNAEYKAVIKELIRFFEGDKKALKKLKKRIKDAAKEMAFEKAANLQMQYDNLHMLSRQLERMPPDLEGKSYYISLESRHEDSFLWVYMQDACVLAWMSFPMEKFVVFEREDGLRLARAVLEIEALRSYVEDEFK